MAPMRTPKCLLSICYKVEEPLLLALFEAWERRLVPIDPSLRVSVPEQDLTASGLRVDPNELAVESPEEGGPQRTGRRSRLHQPDAGMPEGAGRRDTRHSSDLSGLDVDEGGLAAHRQEHRARAQAEKKAPRLRLAS